MQQPDPKMIFDKMSDTEKNKISLLLKLGGMNRFGKSKNSETEIEMNCLFDVYPTHSKPRI